MKIEGKIVCVTGAGDFLSQKRGLWDNSRRT